MIDQQKASMPGQVINVGIYGATKAGKTRFLFELLDRWKQQDRLLSQSTQVLSFLAQVRADIETRGGSMPTVAKTEGIRVSVLRDTSERPWQFIFRDLRGELLTDEIPPNGQIARAGVVANQVKECNAFLFFFDPASSENRAEIDKHHQRELNRATRFIECVLKVRENRLLPIIFVLTHLDCWENNAEIRSKAERWVIDVHAKLVELYDSRLRRLYPKSIVDRSRIFFSVSSVSRTQEADKQLEKVIEQLNDLVAESAAYQRQLRKPSGPALVAGILFVFLFLVFILLFSSTGGLPPPPKKGNDRIVVAEMREQEILTELDELERLLKAHPRGMQLPSVEEAKKLNYHLRWLAQRLEPDSGGMTGLSNATQQRMQSAFGAAAKLVHEKAESKAFSPAALIPILAGYLEDLPDMASTSPTLAEAQARFWQLQREHVVEQLANILKRRYEVASQPIDTLAEVVSKLRDFEHEVGRCKVFGPQARQDLVQEIQTARTFCEDRRNTRSYAATFRVLSASYASDKKVDLAWRAITVQSPGQPSVDYALEPNRKSDTELWFNTKRPFYQITLGLGVPVTAIVSVHDMAEDKWRKLHEFDLTSEPGPLASLGLPLLRRDQPEVAKLLQWEGMELKLEFSGFPRVPPLIWDASPSAKERKP